MRPIVLALLLAAGCASRSADDAGVVRDAPAQDAGPRTSTGAACAADGDCAGLRCLTRFDRACTGPVRPHTWHFDFHGGQCNPAIDDAGTIPGGCPAGSQLTTVITGCDGYRFRYCAARCAGDGDCRLGEGYRCDPEALLCVPPAPVPAPDDAGSDGG